MVITCVDNHNSVLYSKAIQLVTLVGVVINILLSALKFVVGFMAGSQALLADAVHSLSDLLTDAIIIIGVRYWSEPADKTHPYGHAKIESLVTGLVAIILALVGIGLAYSAVISLQQHYIYAEYIKQNSDNSNSTRSSQFSDTTVSDNPDISILLDTSAPLSNLTESDSYPTAPDIPAWSAFFVALFSIASKEWLYRYTQRRAYQLHSSALSANAWHHRSDALSSIPVAVTVLVSNFWPHYAFLDPAAALVVAAFVIRASLKLLNPVFATLLDASGSDQDILKIQDTAEAVIGVREAHAIRTRQLGNNSLEVDMDILVDPHISVAAGHEISELVYNAVVNLPSPRIVEVIIHIEPDFVIHRESQRRKSVQQQDNNNDT